TRRSAGRRHPGPAAGSGCGGRTSGSQQGDVGIGYGRGGPRRAQDGAAGQRQRARLVRLSACFSGTSPMRIISFNANGIRSASSKGFFDWLGQQDADVVCLQETKSQEHQLADACFRPDGHHCFYRDATTKQGYSGVAIYARREPDEVRTVLGRPDFDDEGRYIEARFGNLSVVSFYIPSGSSGELRQ